MSGSWIKIRQVVIGAENIEATSKELRETLGLAPGFADPILETIGLADETVVVGPDAYLEVVAALRDDVSLATWITRGGGGGGYALSIQVPDLTPHLEAAAAAGVRTVADLEVYGHRIVQLHPGDLGLLVELDEIADPDAWFWDDVDKQHPQAPLVDDIRAVQLSSPDPRAQATLWSTVFGVPLTRADSGDPQIDLGSRSVRFAAGDRRYLCAVDLAVVPGSELPSGPLTISGVTLNLLG